MLVLLRKERIQEKAHGELEVLALINKRLNLILTGCLLSTSHLLETGNLGILSFPKFPDLRSYLSACMKVFTSSPNCVKVKVISIFTFAFYLLPYIVYLPPSLILYLLSSRLLIGAFTLAWCL